MFIFKARRERESVIAQSMISLYCKSHHTSKGSLCDECLQLSTYAEKRLLSCMYGEIKPVCKHCPVHCYSPSRREEMRKVMSWAGPRMIYIKPGYAIMHLIDKLTAPKPKTKPLTKKKMGNQ